MESELNKRSFNDLDCEDQMLEEEEAGDDVMDLNFTPAGNDAEGDSAMDTEQANIDWEFYDPSEDQFHSIKT